ncbi:hypothetical protein B0T26DRAFT_617366, partial [Lasiosphaeria miniovina]
NLLPSSANEKDLSPHEVFVTAVGLPKEARKPYIRHLHSYYCNAYCYMKPKWRTQGDKFEPRARVGKLVGYDDMHGRIYWIYDQEKQQVVRVSAVKFREQDDPEPSARE